MHSSEISFNIHDAPPTIEQLEGLREQSDSKFVKSIFILAICGGFVCNGIFTLAAPYDFGQPIWFAWICLIGGLTGLPSCLFKAVRAGKSSTRFELGGADTSMVIKEETNNSLVIKYCEGVGAQGRGLIADEVDMLLTYFTDEKSVGRIKASMAHPSSLFPLGLP